MLPINKEIAEWLRYLRLESELDQKTLAKKLKIGSQQVSNWERGLCSIPLKHLNKFCLEVGINIEDAVDYFTDYYKDSLKKKLKISKDIKR